MYPTHNTPPEAMTAEQRRAEIAGLLANGLVRLRTAHLHPPASQDSEGEFGLGFSGEQRVHTDPAHSPETEV